MIAKYFTETSNKVELRINRVRINRARLVLQYPLLMIKVDYSCISPKNDTGSVFSQTSWCLNFFRVTFMASRGQFPTQF